MIKAIFLKKVRNLLFQNKFEQRKKFEDLKKQFSYIYLKLKKQNIEKFMVKSWTERNAELEIIFLEDPPFSFLNNPTIMATMFVTSGGKFLKEELNYLEKKVSKKKKLKTFLEEDYIGEPLLFNAKYCTSHNSIHHLYHIFRFLETIKCDLNKFKTVIEWGGGYGNLAKIFLRLIEKKPTYILIDTPLFSCIQWLYLTTILGQKGVKLIQTPDDPITKGIINILPICFLEHFNLNTDLFISTWAISESSEFSQNYVLNKNWFNSKHILLAFTEREAPFPTTLREEIYKKKEIKIESIDFLKGNKYAFH